MFNFTSQRDLRWDWILWSAMAFVAAIATICLVEDGAVIVLSIAAFAALYKIGVEFIAFCDGFKSKLFESAHRESSSNASANFAPD